MEHGQQEKKDQIADKHRTLKGPLFWLFITSSALAVIAAVFQNFYLSFFGWTFDGTGYLFLLLALYLPLVFLVFPSGRKASREKLPWYDFVLFLLALVSALYCCIHSMDILTMGWEVVAPWPAKIFALILLGLVLESARRTGGLVFCLVCAFFATYPLFANFMPGFLHGKSLHFWRTVTYHAMGPESIIGIPLRVVGTILIGFMIFAVALQKTGAGKFFLDLAQSLLGTVRGGAAKVSIFSSALMGSISGSVISNILSTGSFTIPAMKRSGYPPHYAGAIEACASAGGVLMPPVMGATAFVMAEVLQVPYLRVIEAAILPSILYYVCLFLQADAYAALHGIKGSPASQCPSLKSVMKEGWFYVTAIALLIYMIVYMGWDSQAAWITTLVLLGMTMFKRATRLNFKGFLDLLMGSGKFMCELTSILAACGLIIGSMSVTGVAHSFSHEVIEFAGGNVALLLILGAFASFVLGMGMTITACYVFLAIVMAPALVQAGYFPLAVHLFVMYWGMASFITPPVALGAFAGATVAGADPMKTGIQAMRLGVAKYFLPFFFVLNPALVMEGSFLEILRVFSTCALGIGFIAGSLEGYVIGLGKMTLWTRPFLFGAGVLLGSPDWMSDLIGLCLGLLVLALMFKGKVRAKAGPEL